MPSSSIKAAQRGVTATRQIIEHLFQGLEVENGQQVCVIEMLQSRFGFRKGLFNEHYIRFILSIKFCNV